MKSIKSVDVKSFVLYGAVLAAFWTFVFGLYYWVLGWIFGAQSWWIDMNFDQLVGLQLCHLAGGDLAQSGQRPGRRSGWSGRGAGL